MCLFPARGYRWTCRLTGSTGFQYVGESSYLKVRPEHRFHIIEEVSLPCGKCVECLQSYSTEWANRCVLEASLHSSNCMITLTYAVSDGSVHKRDVQLFMKRLRKFVKVPVRFFLSGEYGKKGKRPHYHVIIFGWRPPDLEYFFTRDEHFVYKSKCVSDVWLGKKDDVWKNLPRLAGFISVEDVTYKSAKYCAKYLQKLSDVPNGCELPFTLMSLRPAIGLNAFKPSWIDVGKMYISGREVGIPRYFRRKFGDSYECFKLRQVRSELMFSTLSDRRELAKQRFGVIRVRGRYFNSNGRFIPPGQDFEPP